MKIKGTIVSKGIAIGKARVIKKPEEIIYAEHGDILFVKTSHPLLATGLMKAVGLVCDVGSITSHICSIAMEMGIPCITQTNDAVEKITSGESVILDANVGIVTLYEENSHEQG